MYNPKEYKNIRMVKVDACLGGHSFGDDVVFAIHQVKEPQTGSVPSSNGQYGIIGIGEKTSLMVLVGTPTETYKNDKVAMLEKTVAEQNKGYLELRDKMRLSEEKNKELTASLNRATSHAESLSNKLVKYDDMIVAIEKYESDIIKMTKHFGTAAMNEALKD